MDSQNDKLFEYQLKDSDFEKEPKISLDLWIPIRRLSEDWSNEAAIKFKRAADLPKIMEFVQTQSILSAMDSDSEEEKTNQLEEEKCKESRILEEELELRQKILADGVKEKSRKIYKKYDDTLNVELRSINSNRRENVFHHKLTHPIPIKKCYTGKHTCDETLATLSDVKIQKASTMPKLRLDDLLPEPLPPLESNLAPKRKIVAEALLHLFSQNIGPTLSVVVDGKPFKCHSILLGVISELFSNRTFANVLYLPGSRIQSRTFVNIYRWLIEPIDGLTLSQLVELLHGAQFLAIKELNQQLWELTHDILKTPERIISMYNLSHNLCINAERVLAPFVGGAWLQYVSTAEFAKLSFKKVQRLLTLDTLAVNSEIEVLYSGCLWVQSDWPARKRHISGLLRGVRFELMPFAFLMIFLFGKDGPPALHAIRHCTTVQEQIYHGLLHQRYIKKKLQGNVGLFPRKWIYDPICYYHHGHECKRVRFVSYHDFTHYLSMLQKHVKTNGERWKPYDSDDIICC